jgi:ZIP family zinc transporter
MGIIDKLVPEKENPHHIRTLEEDCKGNGKGLGKRRRRQNNHECDRRLSKIGFMTAIAIAIHNFPEGIVTFFSTVQSPHLGIILAVSIAIHNIPEGISISVPIYHATNDKMKSIRAAFFSGLTEPLGALLGYIILSSFFNDTIMGIILAIVAGIMVYISLDELLPTAREYGEPHIALYGLFSGMFIMAISLILFQV